jgi:iron complex outermembrane receptor protein
VAAGIFRSSQDSPVSYSDLYVNTQRDGIAEHLLVGNPDQRVASTSGEVRLTGHFQESRGSDDVVLLARGRDTAAKYGGSDVRTRAPRHPVRATGARFCRLHEPGKLMVDFATVRQLN